MRPPRGQLYHVAPASLRSRIETEGVTAGSVTDDLREALAFAVFYGEVEPQPWDLWEVRAEPHQLGPDEDYNRAGIDAAWAVLEPLPAVLYKPALAFAPDVR